MRDLSTKIAEATADALDQLTAIFESIFTPFCLKVSPLKVVTGKILADQFMAILQGSILLASCHQQTERIKEAILSFKVYIKMINKAD